MKRYLDPTWSRRRVLAASVGAAVGSLATSLGASAALAALKRRTPLQPAGPYYPPLKPLAVDSDLALAPGKSERAEGQLIYVAGRVVDRAGRPVRDTRLEIWHANTFGRYSHPLHRDGSLRPDPNFQGWGHDLVDEEGAYSFRTVKPGPFPASETWLRPPHIHFAIFPPGSNPFTTQMYFAGEPQNETDPLLNGVPDAKDRALLVVELQPPPPDYEAESLVASFDVVLGSGLLETGIVPEPWFHLG